MPMPQLKVLSSSASDMPAVSASQRNTGGSGQASRSISQAEPVRQDAGQVLGQPAAGDMGEACTPPARTAARAGFT